MGIIKILYIIIIKYSFFFNVDWSILIGILQEDEQIM